MDRDLVASERTRARLTRSRDADRLELLPLGVADDNRATDLGAERSCRDERMRTIDFVDDEAERCRRGAAQSGHAAAARHATELHVLRRVDRVAFVGKRV